MLRYLQGTLSYDIQFRKSKTLSLVTYRDVDWALSIDNRRSISGMCIFLGSDLVSWSSKKQPMVSESSTEAEYCGIGTATVEVMWFQSLLHELHISLPFSHIIWSANVSVITLCKIPLCFPKTSILALISCLYGNLL